VNTFTSIVAACLIGTCGAAQQPEDNLKALASIETSAGTGVQERQLFNPFHGTSIAGNYLSGRFAQQHHDWGNASDFTRRVLEIDAQDPELIKRAMVLAMGSGDTAKAMTTALDVLKTEPDSALALLFLASYQIQKQDFEKAAAYIERVPESGLSDFIMPLLQSWADAGRGKMNIGRLNTNAIHNYHAILIADFLKKPGKIEKLLANSLVVKEISPESLARIADTYAYINQKKTALDLYNKVLEAWPNNKKIKSKIEALKAGKKIDGFEPVANAVEGASRALFDTAQTLYQEYSDDSARVFAHMALSLDPGYTNAKLLLARIATRNERYIQATQYYKSIGPDDEHYLESRRRAADLLEEMDKIDEAILELQYLVDEHDDLEALIQIGDVYRHAEKFKKAVSYYNKAAKTFDGPIPDNYWHIYYMRGMCYERLGKWKKAEKDLKTALEFQPDHPLILNYLGYAWADQGTNLDESLKMIRQAVTLRPTDGYITDSLGWVLYRRGEYQAAVPHLEKAIELLPYDPVINDHLGDAYWRVGRKLEARFQWERAKNDAEENDEKLISTLDKKLREGMESLPEIREANSQQGDSKILSP